MGCFCETGSFGGSQPPPDPFLFSKLSNRIGICWGFLEKIIHARAFGGLIAVVTAASKTLRPKLNIDPTLTDLNSLLRTWAWVLSKEKERVLVWLLSLSNHDGKM